MDSLNPVPQLVSDQADGNPALPVALRIRRRFNLASLQGKLIIPYVILTLLIAMAGTYIVTRLVTSSIRERFDNQTNEANRVAADSLVRQEQQNLADLRLMAFTEGITQSLLSRNALEIQNLLTPLALNNHIEAVTAVDLDGLEILTLARNPDSGQYITAQGTDFSGEALITKILNNGSDSQGDKFAGLLQTGRGPYLFTSGPVRSSSGQLTGVLMIGSRLQSLLTQLKQQALADVVVLDQNGKLLATTLAPPEGGYGLLEMTPQAAADLDLSATHALSLYNRDFQIVYAPLIVRQQRIGILGVVLPSDYLVEAEVTSRNSFSLIFALGTLIVILLGYVLSQSIARPILRLRSISQAVAAGDLDQQTGLRSSDEIGELATAFDAMTLHLRERTAEAARLYTESVQRNKELAEINTRLQATQQQLIQSEKLAAIGQLTAGIVHDVKNPLTVIKGTAEILQEEPGLGPEVLQSLSIIRDSATKANQIVSDLLKFARQSTPEMHYQDLKATVESALRITAYFARKANIQVVADLPDHSVLLTYDSQQIEQVLVNMIQNAIQAMPHGGTLRMNLSQAHEAAAIAIQDTGTGIPPENLLRIFDPFFTTKPEGEGTGLGLSVSYGIVARHKGRVDVESKVGQGTTFTILLPTSTPEPGAKESL